jgi:pimeloyl-ACP methyl ester carboxylesterase
MVSTKYIERLGQPRLAVSISGKCPRILFVHGCTETSAIWLPLLQALSDAGIESAAVDLRGHGKSDGHELLQESGIEDYVADAMSVLEQMPSLRVVVGHSMGGLVTQLLAARHEIAHAVLIASSPVCGMKADGMRMARRHPWTFFMASLRRSFKRLYLNEEVTRSLLFHPQTPLATVRQFMSQVQEDSWRAGSEMNTLLPDSRAIRCPVTVIAGSDDFMVSRASTEATASAYGTEAIYINRCAHMVPLEANAAELSRIIINTALYTSDRDA